MATYFLDADTGPRPEKDIPRILIERGLKVECHDDHFPERTPDYRWLRKCGEEGWIAVTKDQRIRYCWRAKLSIMRSGAKLFVMVGEGRTHEQLAKNFANTAHLVEKMAGNHDGPLIARVYWAGDERFESGRPGTVREWLTYEDWQALEREHDEAYERGERFRSRCY